MSTTRDFKSLGIWAENATTTVPITPSTGVAYRNESLTPAQFVVGTPANEPVRIDNYDQQFFLTTSFTDMIDKHGIVGWSDSVSYDVPALVWGSSGLFYTALQASLGQDPVSSPSYWKVLVNGADVEAALIAYENAISSQTASSEGTRLVGHTGETAFAAIDSKVGTAALAASTGSQLVGTPAGLLSNNVPFAIATYSATGAQVPGTPIFGLQAAALLISGGGAVNGAMRCFFTSPRANNTYRVETYLGATHVTPYNQNSDLPNFCEWQKLNQTNSQFELLNFRMTGTNGSVQPGLQASVFVTVKVFQS